MTYPTINTYDSINLNPYHDMLKYYVLKSVKGEECHDDIGIMVYANKNFSTGRQVKIAVVLGDIRTKSERLKITDKNELSVCYFSVAGFNGSKDKENVTSHTGLIVIDIDKKDNPSLDFEELKKALYRDKFIYAYFSSPNGGIKIVVNTTVKSIEQHESYYYSIVDYLYQRYTQIIKIDTTGVNINRACYLPYDDHAYYNPSAHQYCMTDEQISQINADILKYKAIRNSDELTLDLEFISFDEHFDNMCNLIKNRTSVGLLSAGDDNEKRTSVGLYDNIFNRYRYYDIQKKVMSTNVPFFELLLWKYYNPNGRNNGLDYSTQIDEHYFKANPQKPISVDNIDGGDGLEVCEILLNKNSVIKEGSRGKTLTSITTKLIFNNPFCHPFHLLKEVSRINDAFCEDPNPIENPKPDEMEVQTIVTSTYNKYLDGTLDFNRVLRKKKQAGKITKRYVFFSRDYVSENEKGKQLEAIRTFQDGRKQKVNHKYHEALHALQDGRKITKKRIAEYMGMTARNLRRHNTEEYDDLIKNYNDALKGKS